MCGEGAAITAGDFSIYIRTLTTIIIIIIIRIAIMITIIIGAMMN